MRLLVALAIAALSVFAVPGARAPAPPPSGVSAHAMAPGRALSEQEALPWADPAEVGVSADGLARIAPHMQRLVDEGRFAGVVTMVARRGRLVHWEAVGYRDLESEDPLARDDIFQIYSMTKPVTAVAVMMLVEGGQLALEDPVARHLPEFADVRVYAGDGPVAPSRPVTVEDLLVHTAGLAYGLGFDPSPVDEMYAEANVFSGDLANLVDEVAALPLVDHPGNRWIYSVASDVLGRLVEVVSGQPFDEFVAERIVTPLRMRDTGFFLPSTAADRLMTMYGVAEGGGLVAIDPRLTVSFDTRPPLPSGGGGLVSTAADYLRFAQMLLNGGELDGVRLLQPETVARMTGNRLDDALTPIGFGSRRVAGYGFGFGFAVLIDASATPEPDNNGLYRWLGIGSTYFWIDPEAELIGLVMTQLYPAGIGTLETEFQTLVYGALQQ